jgi:hypothetical protein
MYTYICTDIHTHVCTHQGGEGLLYQLRLHNAVHVDAPPPTPRQESSTGVIRISDDDDDTPELEWEEYSGPLQILLERCEGTRGRASVQYTTYGTNDDDPDYTPMEGVVEWDDGVCFVCRCTQMKWTLS